jgi:hypothetical protein
MSKFNQLWNNFPDKNLMTLKCQNKQDDGSKPFGNYCAILLSESLIKSGVVTNNARTRKCWSHTGAKHILLAEEMAVWLKESSLHWLGMLELVKPTSFQEDLNNKTGIIFFKDYWQRGNESLSSRSGDHIDLWNKDKITSGGMTSRAIYEFFGVVSDLNESKEIWFWEVK